MSLVLNMVGGTGGAGLKDTDAVLIVTVPTGSTVTATKGGTTLTPTMWVKAADNTLDCALFVISPSLFDAQNPWTVTAMFGTDTASTTVIIDDNKEYEVTIEYLTYIYRASSGICLLATNSSVWSKTNGQGGIYETASYGDSGLQMAINDTLTTWTYYLAIQYAPNNVVSMLDFNGISTVSIFVESMITSGSGVRGCIALSTTKLEGAYVSEPNLYTFVGAAICDIASTPVGNRVDIDVSGYTGQYYLYVGLASGVTQLPSQSFNNSLTGTGEMLVTAIGYK